MDTTSFPRAYIFQNIKSRDILCIPGSQNKRLWPMQVDQLQWLRKPYSNSQIGHCIRQVLDISREIPLQDKEKDVLKNETGYSLDGKSLQKYYKYIAIWVNDGKEKIISPHYTAKSGYTIQLFQYRDGAFFGMSPETMRNLPLDCTDEELGKSILYAFDAV